MKIVIVDDDKTIRLILSALCESEGHEVLAEFGDGNGVVDFVTAQRPDVVCLDFTLPGTDGLALLVEMDTAANRVDVVMITGSDDPELKGHAADLGAAGFIRKPFEQDQVINELKAIEETRRIAAQAAEPPPATVPVPAPPETAPSPAEPAADPVVEPITSVVPRSAVIVDDSGSIRLLLKGILDGLGIKVLGFAANGKEGIEVVRKTRPALVCLDVDMPVMGGIEALAQVRAASPHTKVVMITGNASRAIVEAAAAGGATGYFLKPIRPAKVEEFMKRLFQR